MLMTNIFCLLAHLFYKEVCVRFVSNADGVVVSRCVVVKSCSVFQIILSDVQAFERLKLGLFIRLIFTRCFICRTRMCPHKLLNTKLVKGFHRDIASEPLARLCMLLGWILQELVLISLANWAGDFNWVILIFHFRII